MVGCCVAGAALRPGCAITAPPLPRAASLSCGTGAPGRRAGASPPQLRSRGPSAASSSASRPASMRSMHRLGMPSQPHTCTGWACQASHTHAQVGHAKPATHMHRLGMPSQPHTWTDWACQASHTHGQ
eukprot:366254-Chlamydomonas_euryale.AAC.8